MPLTLASVDTVLVGRLRGKLASLSLSVLVDGTNPDLMDSIRKALAWVGVVPADPALVTDADLAPIPAGGPTERFLDAATLELLYVMLGQCVDVDQMLDSEQQMLSQVARQIEAMIKMLEARLLKPYGPGMVKPVVAPSPVGVPIPNDPFIVPNRTSYSGYPYWPYPNPQT